ncbi:MAG: hypothetical protein C4287_23200 [Leptolyngbya sp. ERB_1_2]
MKHILTITACILTFAVNIYCQITTDDVARALAQSPLRDDIRITTRTGSFGTYSFIGAVFYLDTEDGQLSPEIDRRSMLLLGTVIPGKILQPAESIDLCIISPYQEQYLLSGGSATFAAADQQVILRNPSYYQLRPYTKPPTQKVCWHMSGETLMKLAQMETIAVKIGTNRGKIARKGLEILRTYAKIVL